MPKAKTMLDELARVLKARKGAGQRAARREDARRSLYWQKEEPWLDDDYKNARRLEDEGNDLFDELGERAIMEYDRLMRSNPGRKDMRKAFKMMPPRLVREHDYFDR